MSKPSWSQVISFVLALVVATAALVTAGLSEDAAQRAALSGHSDPAIP